MNKAKYCILYLIDANFYNIFFYPSKDDYYNIFFYPNKANSYNIFSNNLVNGDTLRRIHHDKTRHEKKNPEKFIL